MAPFAEEVIKIPSISDPRTPTPHLSAPFASDTISSLFWKIQDSMAYVKML
jgi:hypothetical protein